MKPEGQKILYYIGIIVGTLGGLLGMAVAIAAAPLFGSIFSLFFIVVFGYFFGGQYLRSRKRKNLLATGLQANGKIIDMWDTGVTVNNQPQIGMKIEVTPPTGAPFTSEITLVISRLQTAYFQVGVSCIVRYDLNNKKTAKYCADISMPEKKGLKRRLIKKISNAVAWSTLHVTKRRLLLCSWQTTTYFSLSSQCLRTCRLNAPALQTHS